MTTEERIRERAYELWMRAGGPHGRSQQFWELARVQIEAEMLREQERMSRKSD